jgi:hypothetical protein
LVIRMEGLRVVAAERRTAGPSASLGMTKFSVVVGPKR